MTHFYEPKNAGHAVTGVAFTISYTEPLTKEAIDKAKTLESQVKSFLPATSLLNPPFVVQGQSNHPVGISFHRAKPDSTYAWILTAQQNFIAAHCADYTRWADVWKRVSGWLTDLHDLVGADKELASVTLQYWDQFTVKKPADASALSKLLRSTSKYLPGRFFLNQELWHLNQGWFEAPTSTLPGKQLSVINMGTASQEVDSEIVLTIDHSIRHDFEKGKVDLFAGQVGQRPIDVLMDVLHENNKNLLRDLLNEEAIASIKLNEK